MRMFIDSVTARAIVTGPMMRAIVRDVGFKVILREWLRLDLSTFAPPDTLTMINPGRDSAPGLPRPAISPPRLRRATRPHAPRRFQRGKADGSAPRVSNG